MFVPLSHPPGQAQCDFGEALVFIGGVERKARCFVLGLPHSDGCFIKAYPAETTQAFLDGHVSAFAFLGGVLRSILYHNTRLAVAKILGEGRRQRTRAFTELQSHYLFDDRFGRPGKGNDKGKVEGLVGYARRNFLAPIPSFESFDALNACLERRCLERMDATLRGHYETTGQRMERDLESLLPLPAAPYDACDKQAGRVSSLSLVRYRTNDYPVPVAYGHRDALVRGYLDRVVISCGSEVIARHPRSYERDGFVFDPIHYLPLLERKTGALEQAAPLQRWDLPDEFGTLRRLLEHHLKELRLPSFLREYGKMAAQCAAENADHPEYLLRLAQLELIGRHQRMVERRIRAARFPAVKSLDTFHFPAIPSVNKALVMELARREYVQRRENVIAVGNSGTGKTHVALGPSASSGGTVRLPAGHVRGLHHRRSTGPRADGGQG